jgi:phosphoglycerate dehydrogenase-like enzyme
VGGIGAEAARLLAAFGVTVLATDAGRTAAPEGVAELHPANALDDLPPRADFVILTVPHASTRAAPHRAQIHGADKIGTPGQNLSR